jgi:hypothetical protein
MRVLAIPLALLIVALLIYLLVRPQLVGSRRRAEAPRTDLRTEWKVDTELRDGITHVLVKQLSGDRELGRQVIGEIPDAAPDWDRRYHEAMAEARSRAAALQAESD